MPYKNLVITNTSPAQAAVQNKSHFYVGFSTVNPKTPGNKLYDFELIKQDIINYFNTRPGERVMKPEFGSVIWSLMFEPLTETTRQLIQEDILKICNSDPRVYPSQVNVREYDKGYMIELTLVTKASNQSSNLMMTFDQQNGLSAQ
jgi:phage baseplate assembly protein W